MVFLSSLGSESLWAKNQAAVSYQQGKLLDIKETKSHSTSYTTRRRSDGSTVTTPTTEEQKHYFITVQAGDLVYVGEYSPMFFGKPSDWIIGDPIQVRFNKNNMILQKTNGKELKAKIKQRIRASEFRP